MDRVGFELGEFGSNFSMQQSVFVCTNADYTVQAFIKRVTSGQFLCTYELFLSGVRIMETLQVVTLLGIWTP
jgi:hypothetical protein